MKVLLLSQWYQPEPEPRVHALAKGLAARGHQVTAVTGVPNYPGGRIYPGYRLSPTPRVEWMDGVRVVRVPLYPERSRSVTKRAANYATFALSAALYGPLMAGPTDVVWAYHPPLSIILPAIAVSFLRKAPLVLEIQDLWPESLEATGMVRNKRILRAIDRFGRWAYRRADALSVISPGFKRHLGAKGVESNRITTIPNWADELVYRPAPADSALSRERGWAGRFNILYAGNMGPAQDLGRVLDAAALLRTSPEIHFVFVGDGLDVEALRGRAVLEGLTNVHFEERVEPEMVARLAAIADALLIHLRKDPLFEITIPSKTISSLACGRPILSVVAGDAGEIVEGSGAGLVCPPGDPAALAAGAKAMYRASPEQRAAWAAAARSCFLERFSQAHLLDQYEQLFGELKHRRRRAGESAA